MGDVSGAHAPERSLEYDLQARAQGVPQWSTVGSHRTAERLRALSCSRLRRGEWALGDDENRPSHHTWLGKKHLPAEAAEQPGKRSRGEGVVVRGIEFERPTWIALFVRYDEDEAAARPEHSRPFVEDGDDVNVVLEVVSGDQRVEGGVTEGELGPLCCDICFAPPTCHVTDAPELTSRDQVHADERRMRLAMPATDLKNLSAAHGGKCRQPLWMGIIIVGGAAR